MKALHYVPQKVFFTTGVGVNEHKLVSFEMALRAARIQQFNLVTVSSILPPHCEIVDIDDGLAVMSPGEIVFCVLSQTATCEAAKMITASIGLAIPANPTQYGYLSEHHACDETGQQSGDYAEKLAMIMLATALGLPGGQDISHKPGEHSALREWIRGSRSVTQTAVGEGQGIWTTTVAAAVFVP